MLTQQFSLENTWRIVVVVVVVDGSDSQYRCKLLHIVLGCDTWIHGAVHISVHNTIRS